MKYPLCFTRQQDFDSWHDFARQARESAAPCTDCPKNYKTKMQQQGRCNPAEVKEMFAHKPAHKRKTIPIFNGVDA